MAIAKIVVDRNLCIGATPCIVAADTVFELDAENKAVLKMKDGGRISEGEKANLEDAAASDDAIMIAAQSCPVKAIFLYDETGKQLFPEA